MKVNKWHRGGKAAPSIGVEGFQAFAFGKPASKRRLSRAKATPRKIVQIRPALDVEPTP